MPNCLYSPDGDVMAVLDWELAYLGDPVADLAWFLFFDWHQSEAFGLPKLEGTPGKEETVRRYEELTGWEVKNLFYNEVLAPIKAGIPILKVYKNLKQMGIDIMAEDIEINNPCTQRIASLLNLPAPGLKKEVIKIEDVKVTIQIHLTGPGGHDWYMIFDHGKKTTHEGKTESPEITLTASVEDWEAIQRGELARTDAALGGKLVIDGDVQLLQQLDALVFKPKE
jgi:putative sterol carrier protein